MWVVSPPFQTAPHRQLGPVYGLSARESMAFVRELRFVLTDDAYQAALKIVQEEVASPDKLAKLEQLGKGRLTMDVVRFGIRPSARAVPLSEALDWIEFKGEPVCRSDRRLSRSWDRPVTSACSRRRSARSWAAAEAQSFGG